jgi:hypothetical protein
MDGGNVLAGVRGQETEDQALADIRRRLGALANKNGALEGAALHVSSLPHS